MFSNFVGKERPLSWVVQFWPVLVSSWVFSLSATWLCKKIAMKLGIVDKPDATVKTHKEPVAYLGGLGILVGLVVGVLAGIQIIYGQPEFETCLRWLLGILAGAAIACFVGLVDDILDILPWQKMLGQVVAAIILLFVGIKPSLHFTTSHLGFTLSNQMEWILSIPVVIFFVLGATNSLNLLDGLDGLCGGVTAIISMGMLFLAVHLSTWRFSDVGDPVRMIICLGLTGGVLGFLPFNRHPAKIFMGDAGSLLLGFVSATLMILFAEDIPRWWMASIMIFGLPILDTATALVRRLINKRPLFVSDRGHIYDQLMDRGYSLKKAVIICYLLAGLYAVIGIAMSQIRTRYAVIVYIVVVLTSAWIVWAKGFLKMEGLRGAARQKKEKDKAG
ncbi:MAG: undecaprenyl/decaprenyl-phosphate alpha-N-acetylglucosaminyl 1-phosphate transferase [Planctomycetes bacterium]|nr:undecaprenyl/decaprenyl-phosphate alpha-N-acetylglucosaminyl 1-phosphate transferase [Planctomycetota bacterium]